MKVQKKLSVKTQVIIGKMVAGVAWIGAGVCGFFDCMSASIVQIAFFVIAVIAAAVMVWSKKEEGDEMADHNLTCALAGSARWMHSIMCLAAIALPIIAFVVDSTEWSWPRVISWTIFILMGIMDLIAGIIFVKLEAE